MPDQASTRYEEHDFPGFKAEMAELCPDCTVIYQNANADASLQQQQFNSVLTQGAKVVVLDPVDSAAAASLVKLAQSQGVKVIAYDRPIPDMPADFYVSFDNKAIGKAIAERPGEAPRRRGRRQGQGRRPADQRLADRRRRRPDPRRHPRGPRRRAATRRSPSSTRPNWAPPKAQEWTSGQIQRFGADIHGVVAANDGTGGGGDRGASRRPASTRCRR